MQKLNAKERAVMDMIAASIREKGYAPSVRDLCEALGYRSTSTVQMYLEKLEAYGYLRREGGKSRSISLCRETAPRAIPVISSEDGRVEDTLDFCYCGEIPEGAALFARRSETTGEYEVLLRQESAEGETLRRLAVIRLL